MNIEFESTVKRVSLEEITTPKIRLEIAPTGIAGLDKVLMGGFPRGAVVLLAGNPGTGKSTVAAQFLYEGCKRGEPGIYLNFVEPKEDFFKHMMLLGMDLYDCERKGLLEYLEAVTIADEEGLVSQLEELVRRAEEKTVKRLVIDSISAMLQIIRSPARVRELLQNIFVGSLKPLKVTTVLIAEHPYGAKVVGYGIEEFIVDAVIILRFRIVRGKMHRTIEIRKARWAPIHQAEFTLHIRPGVVVEVSLPEEPEEIPTPDYSRVINLCNLIRGVPCEVAGGDEKILSKTCKHFNMPQGSQILVGVNSLANTLTVLGGLAAGLLAAGYKSVFVISFKNSGRSIADTVKTILQAGGSGGSEAPKHIELSTLSINPTAYTLPELTDIVTEVVRKFRPKILLLEGLEVIEIVEEKKEKYYSALYNMIIRGKRAKTTSFYLYSLPSRAYLRELPITPLFDAILYVEANPRSILEYTYSGAILEVNFDVYHPFIHTRIPLICRLGRSISERLAGVSK